MHANICINGAINLAHKLHVINCIVWSSPEKSIVVLLFLLWRRWQLLNSIEIKNKIIRCVTSWKCQSNIMQKWQTTNQPTSFQPCFLLQWQSRKKNSHRPTRLICCFHNHFWKLIRPMRCLQIKIDITFDATL